MSTTSKALLWALVAIVPLAIGAVALARWDRAAAVAAAETEARRSAESIARTVEFTTNISLRQLAAVADDPRFVAAIARSDWQWIEDDLQHIGINPVWRGVAAINPAGEIVARSGIVGSEASVTLPPGGGVTIVPRVGLVAPRAVVAVPVQFGDGRGLLVAVQTLGVVEQALDEGPPESRNVVVRPDGTVLIGPGPGTLEEERLVLEEGGTTTKLGGRTYAVATVPILEGSAHVASLQAPDAFRRGSGAVLALMAVVAVATAIAVGAWRLQLGRSEERLRRRERELGTLQDLATDATVSPSREQILRMAGLRVTELLPDVESTWIALGSGSDRVQLHPTWPRLGPPAELAVDGNQLLARVLQHGHRESGVERRPGVAWVDRGFPADRWQTWTPVVAHGRILGAMACVFRHEREELAPEEGRLLDGLAATLAVALESWERLAALSRERAVLATVVESSPDGILALDAENRIFLENPAARETLAAGEPLTGSTLDEVLARTGDELVFEADPRRKVAEARRGATTRNSFRLRLGENLRIMESLTAPLRLPGGGTGALVSIRDVSARAELEEVRRLHAKVSQLAAEAAERAALLEQVLAAGEIGIAFLDPGGRVAYCNERFGALLGMDPPAPGTPARAVLEAIRDHVTDDLRSLEEDAVLHVTNGFKRILALRSVEVRNRQGQLVGRLLALRDETAQRELEEAREAFIGVAAHELKNPLSVLRLKAEIGLRDPAKARQSLDDILRRTRELQELIDRLLEATRAELHRLEIRKEEVEVLACVREAAEPYMEKADIEVHGDPAVRALADPIRLKQVVSNLLSNAVRYAGDEPIEIVVAESGGWVRVAVRDQGPGIAPEEQAHIFDSFAQGRAGTRGPGLGIGLYLSQRIAEAHGGRIDLQSAPGMGSTFTLLLPALGDGAPRYGDGGTQVEAYP